MCNPTKTLRVALVLEWLSIAVGIAAEFALENTLPPELQSYVTARDDAPMSIPEVALLSVGALALLVGLVSSIALWFRRRWARLPYTITTLLFTLSVLPDGPSVQSALGAFFGELSVLIPGFIIALIYFAPIQFHESANA